MIEPAPSINGKRTWRFTRINSGDRRDPRYYDETDRRRVLAQKGFDMDRHIERTRHGTCGELIYTQTAGESAGRQTPTEIYDPLAELDALDRLRMGDLTREYMGHRADREAVGV